ncbi:MAG: response regulator transcription factor [Oscillospiraceae bacterium]|nr:response regulator transcription factor [Oscillospiraceae bacterium]
MIYLVEDDSAVREMEEYALKTAGFEVRGFEEGASFFHVCESISPELIVLDIMLPGEDGLTILKKLRGDVRMCAVPVILVTARSSELDLVKGFDSGADDYISKPFGVLEFISRVKALVRRSSADAIGVPLQDTEAINETLHNVLRFYGIEMDTEARAVSYEGDEIRLTLKEYELLKYFLLNPTRVFTREHLISIIWGYDFEGESRTVDMHIKTLRQKLGDAGRFIQTVRGVGYKLKSPDDKH